jgi:hypothetical protein
VPSCVYGPHEGPGGDEETVTVKLVKPDFRRQQPVRAYKCSACGKLFEWDPMTSYWYGSVKDCENGNLERIRWACSRECKGRIARTIG